MHKISRGACESCLASAGRHGRLHTWQGCPASQPPVRRVPSERAPFVAASGVFSPDPPEQLFPVCTCSGRYVTLFLPSFPANLLAKRTTHRPFHYSTTALQYLSYYLLPSYHLLLFHRCLYCSEYFQPTPLVLFRTSTF